MNYRISKYKPLRKIYVFTISSVALFLNILLEVLDLRLRLGGKFVTIRGYFPLDSVFTFLRCVHVKLMLTFSVHL